VKRTAELGKVGNNIPRSHGERIKNKHRFDELKLQRAQKSQDKMTKEINDDRPNT
jgi:hypothetical protein